MTTPGETMAHESPTLTTDSHNFNVERDSFSSSSVYESNYTMVAASLPLLDQLDSATPLLTELSLKQRLNLLGEDDRRLLNGISQILLSSNQRVTIPRTRLLSWKTDLERREDCPDFIKFVDQYLQLRTVIAALRYRRDGNNQSQAKDNINLWSMHPLGKKICENWKEKDFAVALIVPQMQELLPLFDEDAYTFYSHFNILLWNMASAAKHNHWFDFDAVAFYTFRWQLAVDYRTANGKAAYERLNRAVEAIVNNAKDIIEKKFTYE